jgi:hypothetical protein
VWITVDSSNLFMMAGYSQTPLIKKLGLKEGMKVSLVNAPKDYMKMLECDISAQLINKIAEADLVHVFATSRRELEKDFLKIVTEAKNNLIIWISWHKKSSGLKTDITEDVIREIILPAGWVDIKVCAVSDIWSALKIVKRKQGS